MVVDKMINNDAFSKWLGIEVVEISDAIGPKCKMCSHLFVFGIILIFVQ